MTNTVQTPYGWEITKEILPGCNIEIQVDEGEGLIVVELVGKKIFHDTPENRSLVGVG